jgi:hypothetical protein
MGNTKRQLSLNKLIVEKRTAATTGAPDTAFSSLDGGLAHRNK